MTSRILIVEDDAALAELVADFLLVAGFVVVTETRGDRARERIVAEKPDLVVLDLALPGMDGLSLCRAVRPAFSGAILMLTANGEEAVQVAGLDVGADDFLVKPVRPRVLLARIRALLRRAGGGAAHEAGHVVVGNVAIDASSRKVRVAGSEVLVTSGEFELLWALASNAGRVLSRAELLEALRGVDYDGIDRSIDLRVSRLRRKIGDDGELPQIIKTVRGVGYIYVKASA